MAAWHYHQLSNFRSVWSPSPGNLLCDRTSGAEVINHYTHPWAAMWHPSSRTAMESHTGDPAWFISRTGKGSTEVSITQVLQGKVPILNSAGRSLYIELPKTQTQPACSVAKRFLCQGIHLTASQLCVGLPVMPQWECEHFDGKTRPIHLNRLLPVFDTKEVLKLCWWVSKRMNIWVLVKWNSYFTKTLGLNLLIVFILFLRNWPN